MGWGTLSDWVSDQIHWLTMQNSSKEGFHYKSAYISLSMQLSIKAMINGISQSTLLHTHLKKNPKLLFQFCKSQHNKKCYLCHIQCILHLFSADGGQSRPSAMPGLYLPLHLAAGRTLQPGSHKREEDCSLVLQVPPPGLTREGEMG